MKTVRIEDGIVVEVIPEYALPVDKWYGAAFAAQCMEAPDEVEQHWTYNAETGEWSEPAPYEPEPETEPKTEASVWDELDAAYTAGYNEGYQEGVNTAYDQ